MDSKPIAGPSRATLTRRTPSLPRTSPSLALDVNGAGPSTRTRAKDGVNIVPQPQPPPPPPPPKKKKVVHRNSVKRERDSDDDDDEDKDTAHEGRSGTHKRVRFDHTVVDNSFWATGRPLKRSIRRSRPGPRQAEEVQDAEEGEEQHVEEVEEGEDAVVHVQRIDGISESEWAARRKNILDDMKKKTDAEIDQWLQDKSDANSKIKRWLKRRMSSPWDEDELAPDLGHDNQPGAEDWRNMNMIPRGLPPSSIILTNRYGRGIFWPWPPCNRQTYDDVMGIIQNPVPQR